MKISGFIFSAFLAVLTGCATWTFEATRSQKFVDESNNYVLVDYGSEKEPRASTFQLSNGLKLPFKSKLKVRVELPDGTRFVAYQRMSSAGNLYMTDDETWEYFEQGTACIIAKKAQDGRGFLIQYQGTLCATVRNPLNERKTTIRANSSTPHGFGRDSSDTRTTK